MNNRVWVIGAGASAADTDGKCPVDKNFFSFFPEKFNSEKNNFNELDEYLKLVYNYDVWEKRCNPPSLEEVFTKVEASLRWLDYLKEEQNTEKSRQNRSLIIKDCVDNYYLPVFNYYHNKIKFLGDDFSEELKLKLERCYKLLKYSVLKIYYECTKGNEFTLHKRLSKLINKNNDQVVITTNYDLILDTTLEGFNRVNGYCQIFWDEFKIPWQNYKKKCDNREITIEEADRKAKEEFKNEYWKKDKSKVTLLKLHGSLNWKHSSESSSFEANHFMRLNNEELKNIDFDLAQKIAITPLVIDKQAKFKPTSKFGRVWAKAFKELSDTDEIVFIGYSFPAADFIAKDLFKSAYILRQKQKGNKLKILVSSKEGEQEIKNKINDVYGKNADIDYQYLSEFKEALDKFTEKQ